MRVAMRADACGGRRSQRTHLGLAGAAASLSFKLASKFQGSNLKSVGIGLLFRLASTNFY